MLRAVPAIMLMALFSVKAFRSAILSLAISSTCAHDTLPTFTRFGSLLPLVILAASINWTAAGGVLMINSKDLSAYTVIRTGSIFPGLSWVLALNCLQNSMMFTPFEPRAGPIGGAGLACAPF